MPKDERTIDEAGAWLARLRGPRKATDQAEFENWYRADPRNAETFDRALAAFGVSSAGSTPADAVTTREALRRHGRSPVRRYAMAAAIAMVVVLSGLALGNSGLFGPQAAMAVMLSTRVGEIRAVKLADGSSMTLDSATRAQVLLRDTERRIVLLHGRARFEPARDSARRFIVSARNEEIEAHGTLFDVDVTDDKISVALLRGTVEVRLIGAPPQRGHGGSRVLTEGQSLVSGSSNLLPSPIPTSPAELRWVSGLLLFDDARLEDVVAATNRYSVQQIRLMDERSRQLRFTGTFRTSETGNLAALLAATFRLHLARNAGGDFLLGADGESPRK